MGGLSDRVALPADAILPDVLAALRRQPNCVLQAPTGAGKTTRVPPALLDGGCARDGMIIVLEPRRLAAQTAARRMAAERNERVGETVGYHVRFQRQASHKTRILVVTEGILLRMLLDDPWLERAAAVVFDEFHERNLQSDLALAMLRRLQLEFRPDLQLIVMSATLDPAPIAAYLQAPIVASEGRLHPVQISYRGAPDSQPLAAAVAGGVMAVLDRTPGDVLVFLPGVGEIRRARTELTARLPPGEFTVQELYGDLSMEQQEQVLRPGDRRKIVLSTNVAETSVTVEGVTAVVDSGLARILRFDPSVGLNRLTVERISKASADQRAGRAGRTAPGVCLRLWTEHAHRFLADREVPEIRRVDLSAARLLLLRWGEADWDSFPWFESPPEAAWEQAGLLLRRLGAVDGDRLTPVGEQLAELPLHPRLGRLMFEGVQHGCADRAALAAALLSERDPLAGSDRREAQHVSSSDLLDRVQALEAFDRHGSTQADVGRLHSGAAHQILRVREQLLRAAQEAGLARDNRCAHDDAAFLRMAVAAFPDRIARRREPHSRRGVLVGGRGVRLDDRSAVRDAELFACIEIEKVGGADALVRQASLVEPEWLPPQGITTQVELTFDSYKERVRALRRTRYEDLVLDEAQVEPADTDEMSRVLAQEAAKQLERVIPLDDEGVSQFLARVRSLRLWMPELELPEFSRDELVKLLPQLCASRRSFADLRRAPWLDYLRAALTPSQLSALEREAPERIAAASGSRIRLVYEPGRPPIMAVRIQEMFGQLDTPRIARGRVKVLLHLLAPNMRPQQVTDDLQGFWKRAYPVIRKELRRRYPKHAWPDAPAQASPERRPQRKRS